ncbi:argininosuccinate synthase [Ferrithrix thermotolerans]|nr:argininosuccinate synthase [Ferrithrix thermotolerans]
MSRRKVVLAYSGGLDTSVAVKWLTIERGYDVVALSVDVGQGEDLQAARDRALASGAVAAEVVDAREEFANDFVVPAIKMNALYEGKYPLVSALSRPLISKHLVEAAYRYKADAVAHGCTGKGNDQVRFEVSIRALNPSLEVEAPVREWGFTRDDTIEYANKHGVTVSATKKSPYSIDQNVFGRAIECGEMEDPWASPPSDVYEMTAVSEMEPQEIVVSFDRGVPVRLDGISMSVFEIVGRLNKVVGAYGFGRIDMVENRRVGIKSREVYESPAGLALIMAHSELEDITLERELAHEKARLSSKWAEAVYDGLWYSPLKEALDTFCEYSQRFVTGDVRLGLEPNRAYVLGRRAERALYDFELATYDSRDAFAHKDSEGFVRIFGLGIETWAKRQLGRS